MKVLVFASCILAAASAAWAPVQPYHGPIHHPVIEHGVPVEPAEVQHARAEHYAALSKAAAQAGPYQEEKYEEKHYNHEDNQYNNQQGNQYNNEQNDEYDGHHENRNYVYSVQHVAPVVHHHHEQPKHAAPAYNNHHYEAPAPAPIHNNHISPAYKTSHVVPAIGHDGRPLDTPEVEAAKAHHFAAFNEALSHVARQPQIGAPQYYRSRRSIHEEHIPIIDKHGVPVEPLEVQHARAEHLAAHAAAGGHSYHHHEEPQYHEEPNHYHEEPHHHVEHHVPKGSADLKLDHHGYVLHQKHAPVYGHHGGHFIPKYDYHGLPLDTDEVEHVKAMHFAAHAKVAHHYL